MKDNHHLIIDCGNSRVKIAVFLSNKIIASFTHEALSVEAIEIIRQEFRPSHCILASVVEISAAVQSYLSTHLHYHQLSWQSPMPISNGYQTPETLGLDRLAAVNAAFATFPHQDVLIFDAGTCLTFDFIDKHGKYHGGGISPGLNMRFKALHTFTQRLPLVKHQNFEGLSGTSTETSILSGVHNGIVAEVEGIIGKYKKDYTGLKVVVTGGDANFFAKKLKSNIFASPNFVLTGLNVILNFNVDQKASA
jgi:type III pantothenate kinase